MTFSDLSLMLKFVKCILLLLTPVRKKETVKCVIEDILPGILLCCFVSWVPLLCGYINHTGKVRNLIIIILGSFEKVSSKNLIQNWKVFLNKHQFTQGRFSPISAYRLMLINILLKISLVSQNPVAKCIVDDLWHCLVWLL